MRLVEHSVLATFDGTGTGGVVGAGYTVTQETYNYCVPAAAGGPAYCYEAVEYQMLQPDGKEILLRSRGSGNGTGQAYFNIYIQDPDGNGTAALRGDPGVLFVYNGMTPEQAAAETDDTVGAAANLPTVSPAGRGPILDGCR